jgi:hypothetical protein
VSQSQHSGRAAVAQFGLGCLHLVPALASEHGIRVSGWLGKFGELLGHMQGVTGVTTWHTPLRDGDDPELRDLVPWFAQGRAADSGSHDLGCQFTLTVDRALLDSLGPLFRGLGRYPGSIDVNISYIRDTPVMIASTREDHGEATGTTALDIVRHHLALQVEDSEMMLDVLEPAPFPADFRVFERQPGSEADQVVTVDIETRPGFDLVDIEVETYGATDEMLDHVLYQVAQETDDYYGLELAVADAERRWAAVIAGFNGFITRHRTRRFSFGGGSTDIRDLMLGFVETKAAILAERHALLAQVEKARNSDVGVLSGYIVERFERLPDFPFDEYTRMLEFLEGRRTQRSDAFIALVSALIGGLVGSLYVLFGGY